MRYMLLGPDGIMYTHDGESKMPAESEVYNSSTHGSIKLSFTARCLMHNLRGAITRAITRGEWSDPRMEVSHARGELAKHISDLEARRPSSIGEIYSDAVGATIGKIRALLGLPPFGGDVVEAVEAAVKDRDAARSEVDELQEQLRTAGDRSQANAWLAVARTLTDVRPGWGRGLQSGMERAVITIRDMAAQAKNAEESAVYWRGEYIKGQEAQKRATEGLRQELVAAHKAATDLLCARPQPLYIQRESVTDAQVDAVWDKLRTGTLSAQNFIGWHRTELRDILRQVFDPKDPLPSGVECGQQAQGGNGRTAEYRAYNSTPGGGNGG